jgi:hypothetical protein
MGLHHIKKLLHIKGNNYQNQETIYRMEDYICQLFNKQRIAVQNIKRAQKMKHKRTNNLINEQAN